MNVLPDKYSRVYPIVRDIIKHHGKAYVVGGAVRDMVMNKPLKDIDIEVHGLFLKELETILQQYGVVSTIGKSFGVLCIHGIDVDWSLPRADSVGRKPIVAIDPYMSIEKAARRRDLTMNAMAIDLETDTLIDPFNGIDAIKNKQLRTPDATLFCDDPLRFYRVMQFISRFEMLPDDELHALCKVIDISAVSRERVEEECKKMLLLSRRPSLGIRWLQSLGRLAEVFSELADTVSIPQNPAWHPEGSVFEHSMQAVDAAADIVQKYENDQTKLIVLYAALCHDLGKATTTVECDGIIKSIGHENETFLTKNMLNRITHNADLIKPIVSLVRHHMAPLQFISQKAHLPAYKRLAHKAWPVSLRLLADLSCADRRGRNGTSHDPLLGPCKEVEQFIENAKKAGVFEQKEVPVLTGADLLEYVSPGPRMGQLLEKAYNIQINKGITDKKTLLDHVLGKKTK